MDPRVLKEQIELTIVIFSTLYSFVRVLPAGARFVTRASDAFDLLMSIKTEREIKTTGLLQLVSGDTPMFNEALDLILGFEGGFVNDPADPGGATNYGIIQSTYNAYRDSLQQARQSVKEITHTEVSTIYKRDYWDGNRCEDIAIIDPLIALIYFDCCVNNGSGAAIRILQRLCNVTPDGVLGPKTLAAIKAKSESDRAKFRLAFIAARLDFYLDLVGSRSIFLKFLPSWCRRLQKLMERAPDYV